MSIGLVYRPPGASENVLLALLLLGPVEQLDRVEPDALEHEHGHDRDADHEQHGLDDLHPGRRQHAAEDDVAEHEGAGEQHRDGEVDPDERLDEHARADHLRDEVEGDDGERPDRRRGARRALAQTEAEDVGDRVLARVAHALGQQEHHRQERDEEADGVQEPVEAVEEDQPRDAQEGRRAEVVAGDGQAVLRARDRAAGGPEGVGAGHALGRPPRDPQRDRDDDREDDDRLDVDCREDGHALRSSSVDAATSSAPWRTGSAPRPPPRSPARGSRPSRRAGRRPGRPCAGTRRPARGP